MDKQEKIQRVAELLNISGNTSKLVRFILLQNLINIDESKLDEIISILEE